MLSVSINWSITALTSYHRLRHKKPVHIMFCMADHYEPATENATPEVARGRVQLLLSKYPILAEKHRDGDGYCPRRTWFFSCTIITISS